MSVAASVLPEAKPRTLLLVFVVAIALILVIQSAASCHDDEDRASVGDWTYLTIVAVADVVLMIVVAAAWRRRVNPHTGLPGRIRRARGRGPFKKQGP